MLGRRSTSLQGAVMPKVRAAAMQPGELEAAGHELEHGAWTKEVLVFLG